MTRNLSFNGLRRVANVPVAARRSIGFNSERARRLLNPDNLWFLSATKCYTTAASACAPREGPTAQRYENNGITEAPPIRNVPVGASVKHALRQRFQENSSIANNNSLSKLLSSVRDGSDASVDSLTSPEPLLDAQRDLDTLPEHDAVHDDQTEPLPQHLPIQIRQGGKDVKEERKTRSKGGMSESEITESLYALLRRHSGRGDVEKVAALVEELICKRREAPNSRLYSAMILVNIDPEVGSIAEVVRLLEEMSNEGLTPDQQVYHNVLQVLAIHPDCLLRDRILRDMRKQWIDLNIRGWHDVAAGYAREGLLEQALDKLEEMKTANVPIQSWLNDMLIYLLCDNDEIDQALRMVKGRVAAGEANMSPSVWYYLFDRACTDLHYHSISFIWHHRIEHKYLNPSSGQCLQSLIASARHGDTLIATDVFRILSSRGTTFLPLHYELLMQAHLSANDLRTALSILCIMHSVKLSPDMSALASLRTYLHVDPARPEQAFSALKELRAAHTIPATAVNVIMETLTDQNRHADVISTYKSLHKICLSGPTTDTFNAIFRSCVYAADKKTAMFFAAEMLELKIRPDSLTYDRLVLVCLKEQGEQGGGDYEDAFRYYRDMLREGWWPRRGTFGEMVKVCCDARDRRAFKLVGKMREVGLQVGPQVRYLQENWPDAMGEVEQFI